MVYFAVDFNKQSKKSNIMKKNLSTRFAIASSFLIATSFMACEKDQNAANGLSNASNSSEMTISGSAVSGEINGLITESAADRMKNNFSKTFSTGNKTESVTFSIKDLSNYLSQLKSKHKSDSVSVNFGVYDETTAVHKKDIGRVTVFFRGNGINTKNGSVAGQEEGDPIGGRNFNHGTIYP